MADYEGCYIKLADDPTYWLIINGQRIKMHNAEEVYRHGIMPLHVVKSDVLEAIPETASPAPPGTGPQKEVRTIRGSSTPFLTVVTRSYYRPVSLAMNQDSLRRQTDPDWEQIVIVDRAGLGSQGSLALVVGERERIGGEYVYILDDDMRLVDFDLVADLKQVVANGPDVIMIKTAVGEQILPSGMVWGNGPIYGEVDMSNFVVRADVWREHCDALLGRAPGCDFRFLSALFDAGCSVRWHDKMVALGEHMTQKAREQPRDIYEMVRACLPELYGEPASILYVGADRAGDPPKLVPGLREVGHHLTLLEIHPPSVEHYRTSAWFDCVVQGDVRALPEELGKRYDFAIWWHGPEHVEASDWAGALANLEGLAGLVVVGCPRGVQVQGAVWGNPYERHLSTLYEADLEALGYVAISAARRPGPGRRLMGWKRIGKNNP